MDAAATVSSNATSEKSLQTRAPGEPENWKWPVAKQIGHLGRGLDERAMRQTKNLHGTLHTHLGIKARLLAPMNDCEEVFLDVADTIVARRVACAAYRQLAQNEKLERGMTDERR